MSQLVGKIVDFDPVVETWEEYAECLQHYFQANGITEADRKKSILLAVMSTQNYKLLKSLLSPVSPNVKSLDEIVGHLAETPSSSSLRDRPALQISLKNKEAGGINCHVCSRTTFVDGTL